jgi:hypothetical protein
VGGYDVRYDYAEDYELWCRGALLGKRYANLPEALTRYRVHGGQVSQQKLALQRERDMLVRRRYLQGLLAGSGSAYLAEFFAAGGLQHARDCAGRTAAIAARPVPAGTGGSGSRAVPPASQPQFGTPLGYP